MSGLPRAAPHGSPAASAFETTPIERIPRGGALPLSFAQQRFWLLHQLDPNAFAYDLLVVHLLRGAVDVAVLGASLGEVVGLHESLRTTFATIDGEPVQFVAPAGAADAPVLSVVELPPGDDARETAVQFALRESERGFDLQTGPLFYFTLLRFGAREHALVVRMHHAVSDAGSMWVFERQLAAAYAARLDGVPSPLGELPVQYADYAAWQRRCYEIEAKRLLAYWRERLEGASTLDLPTDRPRPAVQTFRGARRRFVIGPSTIDALKELSKQERCTLFMTMLAAFQTLLARYAGQDDIVVGSAVANRARPETGVLSGPLFNTVVVRSDLSGNPTFREALGRVREVAFGAFDHAEMPFEQLVIEIPPPRDPSRNPWFQVLFNVLRYGEPLSLRGLEVETVEPDRGTAMLDLSLTVFEADAKPGAVDRNARAYLEYNVDLFDEATIARMQQHLLLLLERVVANPDLRITEIPILTEEEQQLLAARNRTARPYPAERCVHELIEATAARTPDAVAVECEGTALRYGELDARANRLAHHLRALGAGPEQRIGICLERSVELPAALLGIWKSGAAYVPLDPQHPADRLRYVLQDAGVELLVTQHSLLEALPEGPRLVCLDRDADAIAARPVSAPERLGRPGNLAYLIYTSGSTGRPKGVQIEHRALVNFLTSMAQQPGFSAHDVLLAVTTLSFDIAALELYLPLLAGARVVIAGSGVPADGRRLAELIESSGATVMQATPATWRLLLDSGWRGDGRITALCGGEALPRDLADQILAGTGALWNMYGPTESTVWSLVHKVQPGVGPVPIGEPIANTEVWLLDQRRQPVPIGVRGELYLGGDGLARGYWNRPELDAEKFIAHPFSVDDTARLYRTGDVARYRADGAIEFCGRADHQVKVRGFRIELGEIETVLLDNPAIEQAVVMVEETVPGDARLVGYTVYDSQRESAVLREVEAEAQLASWRAIWDEAYRQRDATPSADSAFDVQGWISSYTQQPIPADEMRAWRDATVARIAALEPRRVLEVGCGTGMLLLPLAPRCERYCGTDFAPSVLAQVRRHVDRLGLRGVELLERVSDDFSRLEFGSFDLVVLNSVAQYLPDIAHLLTVLQRAVALLRDGGCVFLGDVRNRRLLEAFHASVQLHRSGDELSRVELGRRVRQQAANEKELLIDPAFFATLPQRLPAVRHVEIELKPSSYHNELTRFRYDVTLHVGRAVATVEPAQWIDASAALPSLSDLRARLAGGGAPVLGLRGIPNARLATEVAALDWLGRDDGPDTAGAFRAALASTPPAGLDPAALYALGDELGLRVATAWSREGPLGDFDAVLWREPDPGARTVASFGRSTVPVRPTRSYANDPLRREVERDLVPRLRRSLERKLPDYMVPSAFVVLDAFPLTPNGKVDRKALRETWGAQAAGADAYVERILAGEEIVQECAVVTQARTPQERQMVAHVVLRAGASATVTELRKLLRAKLPAHLLPSAFTLVDELPRTPHGEVDRRALRGDAAARQGGRYVAPRTRTEERLAAIWEQVLGVERVSATDNFFDLGGHSMLAMRAVFAIEKELGARVLPWELRIQDLGQLGEMCDRRASAKDAPAAEVLEAAAPSRPGLLGRLKSRLLGGKEERAPAADDARTS